MKLFNVTGIARNGTPTTSQIKAPSLPVVVDALETWIKNQQRLASQYPSYDDQAFIRFYVFDVEGRELTEFNANLIIIGTTVFRKGGSNEDQA